MQFEHGARTHVGRVAILWHGPTAGTGGQVDRIERMLWENLSKFDALQAQLLRGRSADDPPQHLDQDDLRRLVDGLFSKQGGVASSLLGGSGKKDGLFLAEQQQMMQEASVLMHSPDGLDWKELRR